MSINEGGRVQSRLRSEYSSLKNFERTDRAIARKKDFLFFNCLFLSCFFTAASLIAYALYNVLSFDNFLVYYIFFFSASFAACLLVKHAKKIKNEERHFVKTLKKSFMRPMHLISRAAALEKNKIQEAADKYNSEVF